MISVLLHTNEEIKRIDNFKSPFTFIKITLKECSVENSLTLCITESHLFFPQIQVQLRKYVHVIKMG